MTDLSISPFIKALPGGRSTEDFTTAHASGSTSQASCIMEAVDAGARLLLIDEDRSATNFMIRDAKMKRLIKKEPITPFTDRVRELAAAGVSSVLVIGGSGEYLGAADRVYLMDEFRIADATEEGRRIYAASDSAPDPAPPVDPSSPPDGTLPHGWRQHRRLSAEGFSSYPAGGYTERLEVSDMGFILIGGERVDVRGIFNLATDAQRNAAAFILRTVMLRHKPEASFVDLPEELAAVYRQITEEGLHAVWSAFFTTMTVPMELPRPSDVLAVLNRMRNLRYGTQS